MKPPITANPIIHGARLGRGEQRERIAEEADQRKRPDSPEGVPGVALLVLLPFQPDEEREGQHERDLERVGRHHGQELLEHWTMFYSARPGFVETEPVISLALERHAGNPRKNALRGSSRRGTFEGKNQKKGRPVAGGAFNRDAALVRDRDRLDQAEAEAEAPFGAAWIHAKQPIPNPGNGVGGDASAGVANADLGLGCTCGDLNRDATAARRVLDRVVYQVRQGLAYPGSVSRRCHRQRLAARTALRRPRRPPVRRDPPSLARARAARQDREPTS